MLKAISPIGVDFTVSWSVCLSDTFVHCAQMAEDIDTISFDYDSTTSLPDRVKIWLTSVANSSQNLSPKWPSPVDLNVGDIRWQIAAELLEIAQWLQWTAYRKPPSLTPTTSVPDNGGPNAS